LVKPWTRIWRALPSICNVSAHCSAWWKRDDQMSNRKRKLMKVGAYLGVSRRSSRRKRIIASSLCLLCL
jgi:hypothetical protein